MKIEQDDESGPSLADILNKATRDLGNKREPVRHKKPNFYAAYRYRNKIKFAMDYLLSTYGQSPSKKFLIVAFGRKWRRALDANYPEHPTEVALSMVAFCLASALEKTLSQQNKELAAFALRAGNKAEPVAAHIFKVLEAAYSLSTDNRVAVKAIGYHALAALDGYSGDEREAFVSERLLDELLQNNNG